MSTLDELPPDQRAALSLLLRQRKSYGEVAQMLRISQRAVHDRAHAALAVLAPREARALTPEQRLAVGDYLLGQHASIAERLQTRTYLGGDAPARAWAQAIAAQLAPLTNGQAPDIPPPTVAPSALTGEGSGGDGGTGDEHTPTAQRTLPPPSSRLGGALIIAAIIVAIVVAVLLINNSGSSHKSTRTTAKTSTSKTSKSAPSVHQILLHPPSPHSRSIGVVEVLTEGAKHGFFIEARNIAPSTGFFYAVWLYNSHTSALPLSKAPAVGSTRRLAGGALLPANAGSFREILLTRETSLRPTHPGHVVLRGPFSL